MSSGYELRYEIVRDAKDMLYEKWRMDCELALRAYETVKERWRSKGQEDVDFPQVVLPEPPSNEQIVLKASELYEFVKKRD